MIVYYTLVTDTAVYRFQINQDQARVTRRISLANVIMPNIPLAK